MRSTSIELIPSLDDLGVADTGQVGSKAANLGELKRAGLPVPDGVVVTTQALSRALGSAGLDASASPEAVAAMALTPISSLPFPLPRRGWEVVPSQCGRPELPRIFPEPRTRGSTRQC